MMLLSGTAGSGSAQDISTLQILLGNPARRRWLMMMVTELTVLF